MSDQTLVRLKTATTITLPAIGLVLEQALLEDLQYRIESDGTLTIFTIDASGEEHEYHASPPFLVETN